MSSDNIIHVDFASRMGRRFTPARVASDPQRLSDCQALPDALFAEAGFEIDPGAIRDALRTLVGR